MDELEKIKPEIEKLREDQLAALRVWLETYRRRPATPPKGVDEWLRRAVGAAIPGLTTDGLLRMTRGED